jgi:hypothetical protein
MHFSSDYASFESTEKLLAGTGQSFGLKKRIKTTKLLLMHIRHYSLLFLLLFKYGA